MNPSEPFSEIPAPEYTSPPGRDAWAGLRRFTSARIALGRTGGSQLTRSVLDFRLAHARAKDAVNATFDAAGLAKQLEGIGLPVLSAATLATDRATFLLRPDLGRVLDEPSRQSLGDYRPTLLHPPDLVIIVSDGLAAAAAERHAAATLLPLVTRLRDAGWTIAPVVIVPGARVKVEDEIGALLGAKYSLMLLGERPGLGASDSLSAYFTVAPAPERTDADRNCVSNIRPEGLPPEDAARKLAWLLLESARTGLSGVKLKDNQPRRALDSAP